jgi:hypothetical protein
MAQRTTRSDGPRGTDRGTPSRRNSRLAELVAELAACDRDVALEAVRSGTGADLADPLELVARAMTDVRHRVLEPQDRLRVVGFLRPEQRRLPRRRAGRAATAVVDRPTDDGQHLVHHGSLRRWERTDAGTDDLFPGPIGDDDVIDLRDRTARFRRPAPGSVPADHPHRPDV